MKKAALLLLFAAVVALVGGSRLLRLNDSEAVHPASKKQDLYLPSKIKLHDLSVILVDSLHTVDNREELKWAAHLLGWQTFQAGHYDIDHGYSYDNFLSKLAKGIQDPISVTIPPGRRKQSLAASLVKKMRFDSAAMQQALGDSSWMSSQRITPKTFVAHFLPATYEMYWTAKPKNMLKRIFKEFDHRALAFYKRYKESTKLSFDQVLTLASIIEGEAIHDDEKADISGLYHNRLSRGMRLQADPTVSFALNEQRRLYFEDYKVKSPYNTYLHRGLPPGPINNPSLSSIKAAIQPADNDYLYMVARPDGYHAFSRSYAEHQRKSAKWREYLRKQARKAEDDSNASQTN